MFEVDEGDRDVLKFLWIRSINVQPVEIIRLRFTRVVFGVNCSPFLLNTTTCHHMETYKCTDPEFVNPFMSMMSVLALMEYNLLTICMNCLKEGGFRLQKFIRRAMSSDSSQ